MKDTIQGFEQILDLEYNQSLLKEKDFNGKDVVYKVKIEHKDFTYFKINFIDSDGVQITRLNLETKESLNEQEEDSVKEFISNKLKSLNLSVN